MPLNLCPSRPLSSGDIPLRGRAHGPPFRRRGARFRWRIEDIAKLFAEILDLFFNRSSPFKLVDCKVD